MVVIRIDTDRGTLYGPTFAETLTYFFGRNETELVWDHHGLAAGYIDGRKVETSALRAMHKGGWVTVARVFRTQELQVLPDGIDRCDDDRYGLGTNAVPPLPAWVYEWAQKLLV